MEEDSTADSSEEGGFESGDMDKDDDHCEKDYHDSAGSGGDSETVEIVAPAKVGKIAASRVRKKPVQVATPQEDGSDSSEDDENGESDY